MKKVALTNYYNFSKKHTNEHVCPKCNRKIKKWALSQCSSCNRYFCRSHMEPSIGHNKKCPYCINSQKAFVTAEPIIDAIRTAEHKINEFRISDSKDLESIIFASIFGNKNLFKIAAENEQSNLSDEQTTADENLESLTGNENPQSSEIPVTDPTVQPSQAVQPPSNETNINEPNQILDDQPEELKEEVLDETKIDEAADLLTKVISESMLEVGVKDASPEFISEVIKHVLADTNKQIRIAKDVLKDVALSDALAEVSSAYAGENLTGFSILSPAQALQAEGIWGDLVKSGALSEELPTTPEAILRNDRRRQLKMQFMNEIGMATNTPADILNTMINSQLNLNSMPSTYLQFLRDQGFNPQITN
jgi:hypothetical protein